MTGDECFFFEAEGFRGFGGSLGCRGKVLPLLDGLLENENLLNDDEGPFASDGNDSEELFEGDFPDFRGSFRWIGEVISFDTAGMSLAGLLKECSLPIAGAGSFLVTNGLLDFGGNCKGELMPALRSSSSCR